jgi:hypothetical protein
LFKLARFDSDTNNLFGSFITKDLESPMAPDFILSKVISDTAIFIMKKNTLDLKKSANSKSPMNLKKPFIDLVKPLFVEVQGKDYVKKKKKKEKNIFTYIVDSNYFISFMTILTLIALFSNDLQTAWLAADIDFTFDIIQSTLLFFFTLEIIMTCIAKKGYIGSFFFWLDLISTISLIQDISFIFNAVLGINTR